MIQRGVLQSDPSAKVEARHDLFSKKTELGFRRQWRKARRNKPDDKAFTP